MRKIVKKPKTGIKIDIFYDWLLLSAPTGFISSGTGGGQPEYLLTGLSLRHLRTFLRTAPQLWFSIVKHKWCLSLLILLFGIFSSLDLDYFTSGKGSKRPGCLPLPAPTVLNRFSRENYRKKV